MCYKFYLCCKNKNMMKLKYNMMLLKVNYDYEIRYDMVLK